MQHFPIKELTLPDLEIHERPQSLFVILVSVHVRRSYGEAPDPKDISKEQNENVRF